MAGIVIKSTIVLFDLFIGAVIYCIYYMIYESSNNKPYKLFCKLIELIVFTIIIYTLTIITTKNVHILIGVFGYFFAQLVVRFCRYILKEFK